MDEENFDEDEDEIDEDAPVSLSRMNYSQIEKLFVYPESAKDILIAKDIYNSGFQKHCSFSTFASSPLFRKLKELHGKDWVPIYKKSRKKRDWLCEWEKNLVLRNFGRFDLSAVYNKLVMLNLLLASETGHPTHRAIKESILHTAKILGDIARTKSRKNEPDDYISRLYRKLNPDSSWRE